MSFISQQPNALKISNQEGTGECPVVVATRRKALLDRISKKACAMVIVHDLDAKSLIIHSRHILENHILNSKENILQTDGDYAWQIISILLRTYIEGYPREGNDSKAQNKMPKGWHGMVKKMPECLAQNLLKYLCLCMEETPPNVLRQQHIITVLQNFDKCLYERGLGKS